MNIIPVIIDNERIQEWIFYIRGVQAMLDSDLAELYGVEARRLNKQVKRNIQRFSSEFCFQLVESEYSALRSQIATLKQA